MNENIYDVRVMRMHTIRGAAAGELFSFVASKRFRFPFIPTPRLSVRAGVVDGSCEDWRIETVVWCPADGHFECQCETENVKHNEDEEDWSDTLAFYRGLAAAFKGLGFYVKDSDGILVAEGSA